MKMKAGILMIMAMMFLYPLKVSHQSITKI